MKLKACSCSVYRPIYPTVCGSPITNTVYVVCGSCGLRTKTFTNEDIKEARNDAISAWNCDNRFISSGKFPTNTYNWYAESLRTKAVVS